MVASNTLAKTKSTPALEEGKPLDYLAVKAFIDPLLDYWIDLLRLDDWSLETAIVDFDKKKNFWAMIKPRPWFRAAYLEVINPFTDPSRMKQGLACSEHAINLEVTIVHELLHLRYDWESMGVKRKNKPAWYTYEAATEITARALVSARHGKERIMHE